MTSVTATHADPRLADLLERVSKEQMQATVRELADDRYAGRRVGTPGGRAAAAWLGERLAELGAEVESSGFTVTGVRELYDTPLLRWRTGGVTRRLEHRRDFAEHLASAELPTARTAPLVPAAHPDLRDRWVLAEPGDWVRACDRAEAHGAAGVLTARDGDAEGWLPKMIAGPPARRMPVLALRSDLHRELLACEAVQVTASMPLRQVTVDGHNVLARFPAPGGELADRTRVLLTAHYDGVGDDPDRRLPAAADNASGVAAVLEAARVLSRAGVTVAFLDAEEAGAWGSAHHAASLPPGTQVINLDGAAMLHQAASVEAGGPAHRLLAVLDQAARLTGVPLRAGAMASDNRRYAAAGLAAVGIGMGMPGYQTPAETPERVQPDTLLAAARLLVATTWLAFQTTCGTRRAGGATSSTTPWGPPDRGQEKPLAR
ncbi:M28 family metallopeptidase [Nonomuraea gerenzanensis]|uniref:Aminopeptidase Y (Arg, Lys, Leu preference) n=1 Tax=Nonomuraea gerenzanensis TaxID=93944 RepID=A0A1M4DYS0_9ACTN|nr:M28 family peptidase [Nonomuraea gerenzanensis]UBU14009.1 M28 family metallopeptidase [Nonomuraea gerenzanensis]SBO91693.1 Aminopeptidase Y (Arg, Lys, Leu preference) [Nonomuraea gerenzanensis]